MVTQGQLTAAIAQLQAYQAAQQAAEEMEAERRRQARTPGSSMLADRQQGQIMYSPSGLTGINFAQRRRRKPQSVNYIPCTSLNSMRRRPGPPKDVDRQCKSSLIRVVPTNIPPGAAR